MDLVWLISRGISGVDGQNLGVWNEKSVLNMIYRDE